MTADKNSSEAIESDLSKYQLSCFNSDGEIDVFNIILVEVNGKHELRLTFRSVMVFVLRKFAFSKADCNFIEKGVLKFESEPQGILEKFGYKHKPNGPLSGVYFFHIEGEISLSIIAQEMQKEEHYSKS